MVILDSFRSSQRLVLESEVLVRRLKEDKDNDSSWTFDVDLQTATDCLHVLASTRNNNTRVESTSCIGKFAQDSNFLFEQAGKLENYFRGISLTARAEEN